MDKPYIWINLRGNDEKNWQIVLKKIDAKQWPNFVKNSVFAYIVENKLDSNEGKSLKNILDSKDYQNFEINRKKEFESNYMMHALIYMMTCWIVILFINSFINSHYLINFYIDSLVGCLALVIMAYNYLEIRREISIFLLDKNILYMLVSAGMLCLCLKLLLPEIIDLTLFIMIIVVFLTKKRVEKDLEKIIKKRG